MATMGHGVTSPQLPELMSSSSRFQILKVMPPISFLRRMKMRFADDFVSFLGVVKRFAQDYF
jgi:hypothetical protein